MAKGTVKLISAEGFEFIVDYKAACVSATIKNMLSSQGAPTACMVHVSTSLQACMLVQMVIGRLTASIMRCCAGSFTETELGEVRFPEISTPILERVCQYCYYKLRWANA